MCIRDRLELATIKLYTKYEVSTFTHYKDMKGDKKCKNWGWFGGYGIIPASSETTPFDRARMTFYSTLIKLYVYLVSFSSYSAFFVESDQFKLTPPAFMRY